MGRGSGGKFELDRVLAKELVVEDRNGFVETKISAVVYQSTGSSFHASSLPSLSSLGAGNTLVKHRSAGASHEAKSWLKA